MHNESINFVRRRLEDGTNLERREIETIVEALKRGQIFESRQNAINQKIRRILQIGFGKHYTAEDINSILNSIEKEYPLFKAKPDEEMSAKNPMYSEKPQSKSISTVIDETILKYIKDLVNRTFETMEKQLRE